MSSILDQRYLAVRAAVVMGALHLTLALRMSLFFRIPIGLKAAKHRRQKNIGDINSTVASNNIPIAKTDTFKVASRTQMNIAEYTSIFMPTLFYMQICINSGQKLDKIGLYSIYLSVLSSILYALGFARCKTLKHSNLMKFVGATVRYVAIAGILYQVFAWSK